MIWGKNRGKISVMNYRFIMNKLIPENGTTHQPADFKQDETQAIDYLNINFINYLLAYF